MTASSNRRATTSIVGQANTGGRTETVAVTEETVVYPVEVFTAGELAAPGAVARALERVQRHGKAATAATRSLPCLGGVYWPSVQIAEGATVVVTHGLGVDVTFAALDVRPSNASALAPVLVDAGQDGPRTRLYVKTTSACTVDLWVFPRPSTAGAATLPTGAMNAALPPVGSGAANGYAISPANIAPGADGQILFTGVNPGTVLPNTLGGLLGWWESDDVVLNGSTVSQVTDKSGRGNHLVQGTANNQPAYVAASPLVNEQPLLTFAADQWLVASAFSAPQPYTAYLVGYLEPGGTNSTIVGSNALWVFNNSTSDWHWDGGATNIDTGLPCSSTPHAICMVMAGAAGNGWYPDTSEAAVKTSTDTGTLAPLYVGSYFGSYPMTGGFAALLVFSGAHTEAQRKAMMAYLASKYGLAVTGPSLVAEWLTPKGDVAFSAAAPGLTTVQAIQHQPVAGTTPGAGAMLLFGSSEWLPIQISGDAAFSGSAQVTVRGLQSVAVSSSAPSSGQILIDQLGFLPNQISGLALWLDSQNVLLDAAGNVSQWTDLSGNARHATQSTATLRPGYIGSQAEYGGRPAISFGGAQALDVSSLPQSQPLTVYVVCDAAAIFQTYVVNDDGALFRVWMYSTTNYTIFDGSAFGTSAIDGGTGAHVLCATGDGAHSNNVLYVDSATSGTNTGAAGTASLSALAVGAENAAAANGMTGTIAAVLVYAGAHSATQRAQVMGYLADRFGLTVSGGTAPGFTGWAPKSVSGDIQLAANGLANLVAIDGLALPTPVGATGTLTASGNVLSWTSSAAAPTWHSQTFTANGTWVAQSTFALFDGYACAGGGGGGGSANASASAYGGGGGGAARRSLRPSSVINGASYAISFGAVGAGGVTGIAGSFAANGGAGGDLTVTGTGVALTWRGGAGGEGGGPIACSVGIAVGGSSDRGEPITAILQTSTQGSVQTYQPAGGGGWSNTSAAVVGAPSAEGFAGGAAGSGISGGGGGGGGPGGAGGAGGAYNTSGTSGNGSDGALLGGGGGGGGGGAAISNLGGRGGNGAAGQLVIWWLA